MAHVKTVLSNKTKRRHYGGVLINHGPFPGNCFFYSLCKHVKINEVQADNGAVVAAICCGLLIRVLVCILFFSFLIFCVHTQRGFAETDDVD